MDKQTAAIARSEEAQRMLTSELWQRAFDDTRRAIQETWAALPTTDSEGARDLHRMLKCLDRVKRCLEAHVSTGKIVQHEIEGRARQQQARPFSMEGIRNALNHWN